MVGKGDKIRVNNSGSNKVWWNLSEAGLSGNWNVKFFVEPDQTTRISESPTPKIAVYPNPSKGSFTVTSDTDMEAIYLITINGQVVYSANPVNKKCMVNLSSLNAGIYFLKIISSAGYAFEKIVIE